jgi:hypothetical protein
VRRLGAVQAQLDSAADLAVRIRRKRSRPGEVADALAEGRIIKTFAFRCATHLMTPKEGGFYMVLRATSRMWELPSWQSFYGLEPADWPAQGGGPRRACRRPADPGPSWASRLPPDQGSAIWASRSPSIRERWSSALPPNRRSRSRRSSSTEKRMASIRRPKAVIWLISVGRMNVA